MASVQVLLATYNGAAYLEPLLESLFRQSHSELSILARDDGSEDETRQILDRAAADPRLRVTAGPNVGVPDAYFELLEQADPADYYAFCDQDDVWLPDKLARAVELLQRLPPAGPSMYCSRQVLVDSELRRVGFSKRPRRDPSFRNALVENIATGCSVVIDRRARDVLVAKRPRETAMHDWWAYTVVAAFGRVVYDPEARVLYRQHSGNVVGARNDSLENWRLRFRRWRHHKKRRVLWEQAAEFDRLFGDRLDAETRRVLTRFLDRRKSTSAGLRYAWAPDVFRQGRLDDCILRMLIALGRI